MSTIGSIMGYAAAQPDTERAHRRRLQFAAGLAIAVVLALAVYGWNYYLLAAAERPFSPKHELLKPSGTIAIKLGYPRIRAVRHHLSLSAAQARSSGWDESARRDTGSTSTSSPD